ncbi:MAG: MBL fold metallo-hydrolase [Firmicutes bacterium]|nr:MBL fold metallo-hydrolase [Bacillota bacterium]
MNLTNSPIPIKIIRAPNPSPKTLQGTNTYILGEKECFVIDPGPLIKSHLNNILTYIQTRELKTIILTHHHLDHSGGAGWLKKETKSFIAASDKSWLNPDIKLTDLGNLQVDSFTLQVIYTPGHSSDHICLFLPETRTLFSGDLILGEGSTTLNPPDGNLKDYMSSLYRLRSLNPTILLPGHGVQGDAVERIDALIQHRKKRHEEILNCWQKGITNPKEIVKILYRDLNPNLLESAVGNVTAHLDAIHQKMEIFQ